MMKKCINLFDERDMDKMYQGSYSEMINECDLLVTDYSSFAVDVAYMYKPVVYYQFDEEEFFGGGGIPRLKGTLTINRTGLEKLFMIMRTIKTR